MLLFLKKGEEEEEEGGGVFCLLVLLWVKGLGLLVKGGANFCAIFVLFFCYFLLFWGRRRQPHHLCHK